MENVNTDVQSCSWSYTIYNPTTEDHIPDTDCKYRIQGREKCPTTGTPHIQGYVLFPKALRWNAFKKAYPTVTHFEKSKGTPYQNFVYCSKDGDFKEIGIRPKAPKSKSTADTTFSEAYAASTVREGIEIIKEKRPRDLAIHGESIERNLKKSKVHHFTAKYKPADFTLPLQADFKVLLIHGPSNLGKTHYAIAHFKNALVVSHIDDLKNLHPDHDGIIFDDMSFKKWPIEAVIHLLDYDLPRSIHVRYGTVLIPANIPKIFTHNTDNPFYSEEMIEDEQRNAIERRFKRINVIEKLF